MSHTLFVIADAADATLSAAERDRVRDILAALPGLHGGSILTPAAPGGDQPFAADGRGPALALQLDFAAAADRDAAMAAGSPLAALGDAASFPNLAAAALSHQPMTGRDFPVPGGAESSADAPPCTFLVTYPGRADDLPAWLDHYDANHPPIMVRFPGIREVATFRPLPVWDSALPFARGTAMQRNKVVFDSVAGLVAALASPVMAEMRADAATFPPYAPRATHHPMDTRVVIPR